MKWIKFPALLLLLSLSLWSMLQAQQKQPPLTLGQVLTGLQTEGATAETRTLAARNQFIARRIRERGITFSLTAEFESELRRAGASEELLKVIREYGPKPTPTPAPPPKPTPTPTSASELPLQTVSFEAIKIIDTGRVLASEQKKARYFTADLGNGVTLEMVEIPAGDFMMGSTDNEVQTALTEAKRYNKDSKREWFTAETPRHRVTLPTFFMGRYEVTQAQWRAVMGGYPSSFKGDNLPVESVSWNDAKEFCQKLSQKTGKTYRLPSEAEWEYAARAGTTTPFAFGETITPEFVNYNGNYPYANAPKGVYREKTVPVGSLGVANAFGLHDLHGNVWEWCEDVWHENYNDAPTNGSAWTGGGNQSRRVLRGGSWLNYGWSCRSAYHNPYAPGERLNYLGFRVVVSART